MTNPLAAAAEELDRLMERIDALEARCVELEAQLQAHQVAQVMTKDEFLRAFPAIKEGTLRDQIWKRRRNGLEAAGAIGRQGRQTLIHPVRYFEWLYGKPDALESPKMRRWDSRAMSSAYPGRK